VHDSQYTTKGSQIRNLAPAVKKPFVVTLLIVPLIWL
jgi:hypothetical protein